ncbi:MAG: cysteine--tRNA ligase [Hyphomicrobiales bacterium]|nr:cysteine--tRNA ligase [Hyphomicrobiales bacterium]
MNGPKHVTQDIKLYNTLTRQKEVFSPIDANNVRMYVCGPTVYDFAHIGNARPVIVFDVLYRLLRQAYGADHVTYARNITDVDDKINARAARDFPDLPLNAAIRQVTEKTANQFQSDMRELGNMDPTHQPRATEFIEQMVAMIQTLIDKGHAYVASGQQGREVLFRVDSMDAYGALSKRKLDDQQAGARVAVEEHKENPADFVLWKESSASEPGWDGVFNGDAIYGRPGWHIECSAMSEAYLGKVFDIHGGGLDLIFPHHENEIAQSCCAHGTDRMANVWMHNGFLQVEGQKMSKSLGNFHTVNEVLATDKVGGRSWPGNVVRLAMLMTHYREPIDFSVKRLEEAENIVRKLARVANDVAGDTQPGTLSQATLAAVHDDLNTPQAIQELQRLAGLAAKDATAAGAFLAGLDLLGIETKVDQSGVDVAAIEAEIERRLAAIADKDWGTADQIRDDLAAQGIQLKDSKDSATGERVTQWEVKA